MLTDKKVRQAKPKEQSYRIADGFGLYLMVTPSGGKLWRWKYRFRGVEKLMTFGKYPAVPLAKAREKLGAARELLASDVDPMEQRKAEKVAAALEDMRSFRAVGGLWHEHWRVDKSTQHVDSTRRRLEANVYPHLGERPIDEIKTPELVRMVKAIEGRGVGDLARRALETTGQISVTELLMATASVIRAPISSLGTFSSLPAAETSPVWMRTRCRGCCEQWRCIRVRW